MTRKPVNSGSKAGAKSRKKPKLKRTTLKDLESSGSSKVRGGVAGARFTPTIGCPYSKDATCFKG